MKYLDGGQVSAETADDAKRLVGKRIRYLRDIDIDKSGRGYYFPRQGLVEDCHARNIVVDGDFISLRELREVVVCSE